MIATAIVVGITLHAGNHLACDFPRVIAASPEEYALVAGAFGPGKPTYAGLLSGAEGITGLAMVVLMTVSFTLATHPFRKGEPKAAGTGSGAAAVTSRLPAPLNRLTGFNAFWYSHHLLGIVYALLLVHGYFLFLVHRWYEKTVRATTATKPISFYYIIITRCSVTVSADRPCARFAFPGTRARPRRTDRDLARLLLLLLLYAAFF
jgi:hypothetical protein